MAMEHTITQDELFDKLVLGGNIAVVVGRRGSGKTSLGFATCEAAHNRQKEVYIVGFPEEARKFLPGYFNLVEDLKEAPNGAFVMMDEAVLQYNARQWRQGRAIDLLEIIDLARHKDLAVVFIAINTAMLDPNILRAIDTLILKEPSLLQEFMERPFLKKFVSKVMGVFQGVPSKERAPIAYVFDDRFEGVIKTSLPTFWSDDISKSWKDYTALADGDVKGIKVIGAASLPLGISPICFKCQFFVHTQYEAWCVKGLDVGVTECAMFAEKKHQKIWSMKREPKPWMDGKWGNPPGTRQCGDCANRQGDIDIGVVCGHYERPIKFIDGACGHYVKMNPPEQYNYNPAPLLDEHRQWDEARKYYAHFKVMDRERRVLWDKWLKYIKDNGGFTNIKDEEGGTDTYQLATGEKTSIHLTQKPSVDVTRFPMSCSCQEWRTTRKCIHADKLAQYILAFAHANTIPKAGDSWISPPRIEEKDERDEKIDGGEAFKKDMKGGPKGEKGGGEHEDGEDGQGGEGGDGEGDEQCPTCAGKGEVQAPDLPEGYMIPCPDCEPIEMIIKGGDEKDGDGPAEGQDGEDGKGKPGKDGDEGDGKEQDGGDGGDQQEGGPEQKEGGGDDAPEQKPIHYEVGDRVTIVATGQVGIIYEIENRQDGSQKLKVRLE